MRLPEEYRRQPEANGTYFSGRHQVTSRSLPGFLKMSAGATRTPEVDVAIIGGGIGGLATALAFKRLTNITARVFER
jgi:hypothetical protein